MARQSTTPPYAVQTLAIADLHADERIQPREQLNRKTIDDYATLYREAAPFESPLPPLDVFQVEEFTHVADGFHRLEAAKQAGRAQLECHVYQGTLHDAMVHAALANVQRGVPYSPGDKERILSRFLADPLMVTHSNRELGRQLGVSHTYVSTIRRRVEAATAIQTAMATVATTTKSQKTKQRQQLASFLGVPDAMLKAVEEANKYYSTTHFIQKMARDAADDGMTLEDAKAAVVAQVQNLATPRKAPRRARSQGKSVTKPLRPEAQAERQAQALYGGLRSAFRQLSTLEAAPVDVVAMLSDDQKLELTEQLDRALTYLTALKAAWPGPAPAPAQRSA